MNRNFRSLGLLLTVLAVAFATAGCNKLKARDMLNKGVAAYKGGQTEQAIEYFKQAKELDPEFLNARLYLATAYASQYIPGAPSEENVRHGQRAVEEYRDVLSQHPNNLSAIDGLGSILFQMAGTPFEPARMEESRSYHLKHIEVQPNDPEPYYWVGVINWTIAFRANNKMRGEFADRARRPIKDTDAMPPPLRQEFAQKHGEMIESGIQHLQKALQIRSDYDDAMAYLNLLYRQKADIVATPDEREYFLTEADRLVDRVKEIKQKRMETPAK